MPLSNATQSAGLELHASLNYDLLFQKALRQVVVDPWPAADDAKAGLLAPCLFWMEELCLPWAAAGPGSVPLLSSGWLQAAVQPDKGQNRKAEAPAPLLALWDLL